MKSIQKWGGIAALYEGVSYILGMIFFLVLVDYTGIVDPVKKIELFRDNLAWMYAMNLIIYVVFGVFMVILSLALYERLKSGSPVLIKTATVFGLIWATVVIASGMVFNIGMETVVRLYENDPYQAGTVWLGIEAVAEGIGGGNEIIGGIWILLVSMTALKLKEFPKVLNYTGLIVGAAGILSAIPPLGSIAGIIFGLVQIIWFLWLGILMTWRAENAG